jgi:hypothetical protein
MCPLQLVGTQTHTHTIYVRLRRTLGPGGGAVALNMRSAVVVVAMEVVRASTLVVDETADARCGTKASKRAE